MNIQVSCDTVNFGGLVRAELSRNPDDCAFREGAQSWSRKALKDAAQVLVMRLEAQKIAPGEPVLIDIGASFDMVAALCAVAMAGGIAVPIDPDLPAARRQAIAEDVAPRLVLRRDTSGKVDLATNATSPRLAPELAFLVYTSGTSGTPKGVEIGHFGYARRLDQIVSANPAQPGDVDLLWTPAGFIGMLDEVFFPLFQGVPSVIASAEARRDPRELARLVARENVTAFRTTPSLLNVIVTDQTADALKAVRNIYCSGEKLEEAVRERVGTLIPANLISFYGASEAPGVAYQLAGASTPQSYTPQAFARVMIASDTGDPQTPGLPGEIWISGCPVAEGYWNRPDLTTERFVEAEGLRWYRTGDLGLAAPDGQFEILGRLDQNEVNINGVRVNLTDTCSALGDLPDIEAAWISAVDRPDRADPLLVAHCVVAPGCDFHARSLRAALAPNVPRAAIPASFIATERLPLTPNGKLDVQALGRVAAAHLETLTPQVAKVDAQATETDPEYLRDVIAEVEHLLDRSGLTGGEDFFDLGGTSLHAVQLALSLSERLGMNLPAEIVFGTENLREIARACTTERTVSTGPLRLLKQGDASVPPLFTINATQNYFRLAQALMTPGTIYNLNMFGLTNALIDRLDALSLQDLAEGLADAVLAQHPAGPWRFMAYCQDGCLAIELARALEARTGVASELFLIDSFFLNHKSTLKMSVMRMVDLGPSYYARKAMQRLRRVVSPRKRPNLKKAETIQETASFVEKSRNDGRLYRKYIDFFTSYSPTSFAGRISLFVSSEWKHVDLRHLRMIMGHKLSVHHFPGLHDTLFMPDGLKKMAPEIDRALMTSDASRNG